MHYRRGFTLVEIMIVVAIIVILAAIAIPQLIESRKMSRLSICMNNMILQERAISQVALNKGAPYGSNIYDFASAEEINSFMKNGEPFCPSGGVYSDGAVGESLSCTYHGTVDAPAALSAMTND